MRRRLPCLMLLALAAGAACAQPVVYRLDPANSFVHLEFLHFNTSTSRARIGPITGDVTLERAERRGSVSLRIPVATVSTGAAVFDERLRRPDLLSTAQYPEAFFVANDFHFDGDRVTEVRGELTVRGVSRPQALRARRFGCHPHPETQREVCGGDFEGELVRSDFGADFLVPLVADRVRLLVQVEGERR